MTEEFVMKLICDGCKKEYLEFPMDEYHNAYHDPNPDWYEIQSKGWNRMCNKNYCAKCVERIESFFKTLDEGNK